MEFDADTYYAKRGVSLTKSFDDFFDGLEADSITEGYPAKVKDDDGRWLAKPGMCYEVKLGTGGDIKFACYRDVCCSVAARVSHV